MLTPQEKRWIVVGISLSKVLKPGINKVIKQEIQDLYQKLVLPPTRIQLQTSSTYQERISPSKWLLKYENINNNASPHRRIDYRVKDEVSLAKLFVEPIMSDFTDFDETLDLSAALSILCQAPKFVGLGIHNIAWDVRTEVRNEWGHCKFATWTQSFYFKCFQRMEKLINSLNLPKASKEKVLKDLQEWKDRGMDMCFGEQISNELLKLVHDEMAVLSTSIDSCSQDHKELRSKLCNLTERFAEDLKALEGDLKSVKEDHSKTKETVFSLKRGIERLRNREKTVPPNTSISGLCWKLLVAFLLLAFVLFLSEQSFGECGMFHYWYSRAALCWKILVVVLLVVVVTFLYQYFTRGTMLRYWFSNCGCIPGHKLSFVFNTLDKQENFCLGHSWQYPASRGPFDPRKTPKVNGVEFEWEKLKNKLGLTFEPMDTPGMHYYLNIDRCAYGGVVQVASWWDNTPQVRGAEIFAVNSEYTQVYYHDNGAWHLYISARDICFTPERVCALPQNNDLTNKHEKKSKLRQRRHQSKT